MLSIELISYSGVGQYKMNYLLGEFFNWIFSFSRNTDEPVGKDLSWPHFYFLVELPVCMEDNMLDLVCLTAQLAISIIPRLNQSVFNSLKLGFTILFWHVMFTKAFDFNMQLFCQFKHFLTYTPSSVLLPQQGRKCHHGDMSAVATSLWLQLSIIKSN